MARTSKRTNLRKLIPRKTASKPQSNATVDSILEAAALILEKDGLDRYTTNLIAKRAGVSIGSLYQYFPTKEAITLTLIERESKVLLSEIMEAVKAKSFKDGIRNLTKAAIRYQLQRPDLARVLDFEENRLSELKPPSESAIRARTLVLDFFKNYVEPHHSALEAIVSDVMTLIRALTDEAGRQGGAQPQALERKIMACVFGYLSSEADLIL